MKLLSALAVALLLAPVPGIAQTKLKFAHGYEISEPFHTSALWAAAEIAKRTQNRYQIEVFPASSLGKEVDVNQGLTLGTVDIIFTGQAFVGRTFGPISIGGGPYMFRDFQHWRAYNASALFAELSDGYFKASGGNKIASVTYFGTRHTTSNKPIAKPEDMKALKIRVPDAPLYLMFPRAVMANPAPIAFAEVYLALQSKTVDAQENPLPTIEAKKFDEVQTHINLTGHIVESLLTVVGGPLWNKLSDADKATFTSVFRDAAERATAEILASEQRLESEFARRGKIMVKSDRAAFMRVIQTFYKDGRLPEGGPLPWPRDVYDRLQAIK